MGKTEPHTAVGSPATRSDGGGNDPEIRRARIAVKARNNPKERFNNLMHHLTAQLVEECLAKIPWSSAPGTDGMTPEQARKNLSWILPPIMDRIHQGNYEAPPVRRVYIPKADGRQRPIGVPQVVDRAIQGSMLRILNEIYEQDFLPSSFGFRPRLGCHHALATIQELLTRSGMKYALEVDIRDFFGSLSHDWLKKFIEFRIGDKRVLKLIQAWLKAGVMEKGEWQPATSRGTPQGGSISPLLANIYLHYVLDLWFTRKIMGQLRRKARLVRYADDFVVLFADQQDLEDFKVLLRTRLAQFNLEIAEAKTHTTDLTPRGNAGGGDRRRITFLGFNIYRAINRKRTGWKVVFQTEGKRFTRAKAAMKAVLRRIMHWDLEKQAERINAILSGHFNYYGLAGNFMRLQDFYWETMRHWRRCLSRRSQHGRQSWEKMKDVLKRYPLLTPRIRIPYGHLASYVRL